MLPQLDISMLASWIIIYQNEGFELKFCESPEMTVTVRYILSWNIQDKKKALQELYVMKHTWKLA